jgi:hypothetical protein
VVTEKGGVKKKRTQVRDYKTKRKFARARMRRLSQATRAKRNQNVYETIATRTESGGKGEEKRDETKKDGGEHVEGTKAGVSGVGEDETANTSEKGKRRG